MVNALWNDGLITVTGPGIYEITEDWQNFVKARKTPASEELAKHIKQAAIDMHAYAVGTFSSAQDLWDNFWEDIDNSIGGPYTEEEEEEFSFMVRHKKEILEELRARFY